MSVPTFTVSGTKATTPAKLDKAVFGMNPENHELLKAAYVRYLANGRINLAVTKTRGKVQGGGRKPWKQKGTGRARFGSSRNPIWRGGGIVFGPTGNENYRKDMNSKAKNIALVQALSLAAQDDKIAVIEDMQSKSAKTKDVVKVLSKVTTKNNVLLVVPKKSAELLRATNNIPTLMVVSSGYLNVFNVLNANTIIFTKASLDEITSKLANKAKPAVKASESEKPKEQK
jgi:large subunit ribosomal protein L4